MGGKQIDDWLTTYGISSPNERANGKIERIGSR